MTLKWLAIVVAVVSLTSAVTGNVVIVVGGGQLPVVANLLAFTTAGTAVVLAVVAELHDRLNDRLNALSKLLVTRLDEIEARTGDRNTGFVEGYLLSHGQDAEIVPFGRRGRGAAER
ncbi:hypothetical protein [Micromonospora sp. RTGN7]|uniref:hypothetical protein n=1 Tax=Micromonospora sp. RTGN7 TaxID=3016526 RepID=UPI0029FECD97|nr:hypothetical protein [Micromonospora sp. RTGN7]